MEQKETTEELSGPQKVLRKLKENGCSIHISRVPQKTKEQFLELADEEFCSDRGMALKWIMDDIPHQDTRMVLTSLENLNNRITALESNFEEKPEASAEEKSCKMCDGTRRRVK